LIFEKLRTLLTEQFAVSEDTITMETSIVDDLGADSLDFVELIMAVEEEFDIPEVNDEELAQLRTVEDVVNFISGKID
jgi:acyl carrier protein